MTAAALERPAPTPPLPPALLDRHRRGAVSSLARLAPGWYLAIEDGDDVTVVALPLGALRIGRSPTAHLCFDDPTVSRRHAVVVRDERGARVLDDRSRNGVLVNGRRVREAALRHGDVLGLGRLRIGVAYAEG